MADLKNTCAARRKITQPLSASGPIPQPPQLPQALGVKFERQHWCDFYDGTKQALVDAGIVADGQFPGDPGRAKSSCSYERDWSQRQRGGPLTAPITVRAHGKRFQVWLRVDENEEGRRRDEVENSAEWRKASAVAEIEVKRAFERLAELPATKKEFAKRAADLFWASWGTFCAAYGQRGPGVCGHWFTAADRERFSDLAEGLYHHIRNTDPQFDATQRMSKVNAARANAAKVDMPLQRLLAAVAAPKNGMLDRG